MAQDCYDDSVDRYRITLSFERSLRQCDCERNECGEETDTVCHCLTRHQLMGPKMTSEDRKMRDDIVKRKDFELLREFDEGFVSCFIYIFNHQISLIF